MTEISLSNDSLMQAIDVVNQRIYKISYDTDTKLVHYFYTTCHKKYPVTPSPIWSDYEDILHHSYTLNVFRIFKDTEARQTSSPEGLIIRKLNESENKFILENIPVIYDALYTENYISAEVLKIEFDKLGINCDIILEEFKDITRVRYRPLKIGDNPADYTYKSEKRNFKQFIIVPKTETDLVQFLFYFNDYIKNSVWLS
jgi:hypothetical protein